MNSLLLQFALMALFMRTATAVDCSNVNNTATAPHTYNCDARQSHC